MDRDDGPEGDLDRAAGRAWAAVERARLAAGRADAGAQVATTDPGEAALSRASGEAAEAADAMFVASRALLAYATQLGFRSLRLHRSVKQR